MNLDHEISCLAEAASPAHARRHRVALSLPRAAAHRFETRA
ncbi:hypothetical protein MPS_1319 [Mycobacterium pseudoshottsii JCM 15466]|nr:hypothetical protein MPS_1319 [Mycobacterium pseudoshottsii JCM 15466]